jgi:hypothetical protein
VRRREILKKLLAKEGPIRFSDAIEGRGKEFFRAAQERGLEGIMAKRKDSRYLPGRRKAILLFDELHFMDRPSFSFGRGQGGLIGARSPLRQFEASFREGGVPLYVDPAPGGPVADELYERIKADVNDPEFLRRFQNGLKTSPVFRGLQIATGTYGAPP